MSTSALHRHPTAPTASGATSRVHRALHAVDSDVARPTGRFRGDLATEHCWPGTKRIHHCLGVVCECVRKTHNDLRSL